MFQIFTGLTSIISLVLTFIVHPAWAWIPIIIVDIIIYLQLWYAKQKYHAKHIEELSQEANELLERYGHYFAMPFASKDFSSSAATSQFAGIIIAVVCLFKGFWWAIVIAAVNWLVMGFAAVSFSPISLLTESNKQMAYEEITDYIDSQRTQD